MLYTEVMFGKLTLVLQHPQQSPVSAEKISLDRGVGRTKERWYHGKGYNSSGQTSHTPATFLFKLLNSMEIILRREFSEIICSRNADHVFCLPFSVATFTWMGMSTVECIAEERNKTGAAFDRQLKEACCCCNVLGSLGNLMFPIDSWRTGLVIGWCHT